MNRAASISFYKPVFNDFLYAPVDAGVNDNPLSLLSALARLDIDPWLEAAELAELPKDRARSRLAALLERLPSRPWAKTESGQIADRLIKLLPPRNTIDVPITQMARGLPRVSFQPRLKLLIFVAIGVYFVALGAHRLSQPTQPEQPAATEMQSPAAPSFR